MVKDCKHVDKEMVKELCEKGGALDLEIKFIKPK